MFRDSAITNWLLRVATPRTDISLNFYLELKNRIINLSTEVFTNEQRIPAELVPVSDDLKPIWWCARAEENIIGVTAAWKEKVKWHWGRFAVDKR